jgi:ParB-like chromosome segregation protein Spo0J
MSAPTTDPTGQWPAATVEMWDIGRVTPSVRNPRVHSAMQIDQIAASMKQWGFTMPLLADENGGLIAGHARLMAAQSLNLPTVPVMTARGWTDAQKRAYLIADNQLAHRGSWDYDMLTAEIGFLKDTDLALDLLGFNDADLAKMCGDELPTADKVAGSEFTDSRFLLLIEFDAEDQLQEAYDELHERGMRVKVMS